MKMLSLAALPLLSLSLVGCAGEELVDELAGETAEDAAGDGKADGAVDGSYTFFTMHGDMRKCAFPMCGGEFLTRVNRSTTKCHDGKTTSDSCYTPELDFSESGLSEAAQFKLRATAAQGVFEGAARPLVRGRFAAQNFNTPRPEMGRFIVTEVWLPQGPNAADGVFARLQDNGLRCIAAPCPSTSEKGLNTSRRADISDIDFSVSGIGEEAIGELVHEMFQPHGLIIAGDRFTVTIDGRKGKGRTATNVWKKLVEQAPCVVGGCSGEICADEPMFSTCEVKPEAVCFETATCERQIEGHCGWTPTPELETCLAQF